MTMRARILQGLVLLGVVAMAVTGCTKGPPPGIEPVPDFQLERFLGQWFEVARLDHRFERGLDNVSASYTRNTDGSIRVVNRGRQSSGNWKDIEGKARIVDDGSQGLLEVSFFGPFYSTYVVFEVGSQYEYAFVTGGDRDVLWLLSRTPTVDQAVYDRFIDRARRLGFKTSELILVDQTQNFYR